MKLKLKVRGPNKANGQLLVNLPKKKLNKFNLPTEVMVEIDNKHKRKNGRKIVRRRNPTSRDSQKIQLNQEN